MQVKADIYAMRCGSKSLIEDDSDDDLMFDLAFTRFSNVESAQPCVTALSVPHAFFPPSLNPSMVNFKDRAIYMIGRMMSPPSGTEFSDPYEYDNAIMECGRCERYGISTGVWQTRSRLNKMRMLSTHCALGDFIYTFFGLTDDDEGSKIDSIERFNAQDDLCGHSPTWTEL